MRIDFSIHCFDMLEFLRITSINVEVQNFLHNFHQLKFQQKNPDNIYNWF